MIRRLHLARFLVALGLFGSAFAVEAQDLGQKVSEPGLFSYQAPKGWKLQNSPISKYTLAMAPPEDNFSANINVVNENNPKPLADYVAANEAFLKSSPLFVNLRVLEEKPFVTANGVEGVRMLVKDTLGKLDLQQIFYLFDAGSGNKFVLTATSLVGDGARYAPIFDASVKTFATP